MSFWKEFKRRNVVKTGIACIILAWLIILPVDIIFPILHLPEWPVTLVTALLIIGFPVSLILFFFNRWNRRFSVARGLMLDLLA